MIYEFILARAGFVTTHDTRESVRRFKKLAIRFVKRANFTREGSDFFRRAPQIIPLREVCPRVFLTSSRRPAVDRIE